MRATRILALLLTLFAGGCYKYVPTDLGQVRPSQKVRLRVDQGELARLLAFADTRGTLGGSFVRADADSLRLVLRSPTSYQEVSIPRSSIQGAELRRVDKPKSLAFSAAAVGIVGVMAWKGFEGGGANRGGDTGGSDESLIPLFSFTLPGWLSFGLGGG